MQPLPVGPLIWDDGGVCVVVVDAAAARPAQRIQDGVELGTHGAGEFALQPPHAIPPLFEFEIAAVLLKLIIDRLRAVWIGGIHHLQGVAVQIGWT
jgi:hypothetical protein